MKRLLILCSLALLASQRPHSAQQSTAPADARVTDDAPHRVGRISYVNGAVSFQPSGASAWSLATLNYSVTSGDRLFADAGARAEVELGWMALRLNERSDVTFSTLGNQYTQVALADGALRITLTRLDPGDSVEVDTPDGAIALLSPARVRIDVGANDDGTILRVDTGAVEVTSRAFSRTVQGPAQLRLTGTDPVTAVEQPIAAADDFDRFSAARDARLASPSKCRYVSRGVPGCADLDEHGRWETDQVYGEVWYPIGMPVGWMPYRFGHWAWIEPWGWVWVDDAPWGYAPFHFGRWMYLSTRWGWVPGPFMPAPWWSPGLVAWVDGAGFGLGIGVQAWFPLGPGEPFIPWYHHSDFYVREINRTNVRGVGDVDAFVRSPAAPRMNREAGLTAVPADAFRGGESISARALRTPADAARRAPLAPHPSVVPNERAAAGGRQPPAQPARNPRRPTVRTDGRAEPSPARPAATPRAASPARRPVIGRALPLQENLPFPVRENAMRAHPGRPLEPQQMQNLRSGRPAGPMLDHEAVPHVAPSGGGRKPM